MTAAPTSRFGIVVSRFNRFLVKEILAGCIETLCRHGVSHDAITVMWCPTSSELPVVAKAAAKSGIFNALICLGVVIRGGTLHDELVTSETASGIVAIGKETGVPAIFGLVTTDSIEQAIKRTSSKTGNRGSEAALTAIEVTDLLSQINSIKSLRNN